MKKIVTLNIILLFLILFKTISGFSQIPTSGLIGCYPFSGNANDYSNNGNNGIVNNAFLTIDRFNRLNNAYSFNGTNAYISLSPVNSFLLGNFTYSTWVKVAAYPANNSVSRIISVGSSNGEQDLSLYNNYTTNWRGWGFSGTNSGNWNYGSLPILNTWYHIAVTRSNTEIRFYINGQYAGNATFSISQASYGNMGQKRAIIGARYDYAQKFNGVIDDIHIYNRALSAAEITLLYNGGINAVTITANPGTTVCFGDNVTFTANVSYIQNPTYQWQVNGTIVGGNSSTYSTTALSNGAIVRCLVFPQATDCEVPVFSNNLTMVVNNSLPLSVSISASPGNAVCKDDIVTFTAIGVNAGANPSYQWKINDINVGTNQSTLTVDTLSNGANVKCVLTSSSTCITNNPATSNIIQMSITEILPLEVTINASPGNVICAGTLVTFNAIGTNGGNNATYQWKLNNINVGSNQPSISFNNLLDGDVVYCVYSSPSSCVSNNPASSTQIVMNVKDIVPLDFQIITSPGTTVCKNTNIQFTAEIIGLPANGVTYQWKINNIDIGLNQNTFNVDTLSSNAIVSCIYGTTDICYTNNPATKQITINVNPNPTIEAGNSIEIGVSEGIVLNTIFSGGLPPYQFNWSPNNTLSDPHIEAPYATPLTTTEYYVEITDANGCKCVDSVKVSIFDFETTFFVPNIFSPNNDQLNDVLYVRGKGIKELQFIVYDRWGKEVFSTTSQENGWDGKFNGKELNPATFIYYIKVKTYDGKIIEKKGNVTLVK